MMNLHHHHHHHRRQRQSQCDAVAKREPAGPVAQLRPVTRQGVGRLALAQQLLDCLVRSLAQRLRLQRAAGTAPAASWRPHWGEVGWPAPLRAGSSALGACRGAGAAVLHTPSGPGSALPPPTRGPGGPGGQGRGVRVAPRRLLQGLFGNRVMGIALDGEMRNGETQRRLGGLSPAAGCAYFKAIEVASASQQKVALLVLGQRLEARRAKSRDAERRLLPAPAHPALARAAPAEVPWYRVGATAHRWSPAAGGRCGHHRADRRAGVYGL